MALRLKESRWGGGQEDPRGGKERTLCQPALTFSGDLSLGKNILPNHRTTFYSPCWDVLRFLGFQDLSQSHHSEGKGEGQPCSPAPGS